MRGFKGVEVFARGRTTRTAVRLRDPAREESVQEDTGPLPFRSAEGKTSRTLEAVHGSGAADVWAVGEAGRVPRGTPPTSP